MRLTRRSLGADEPNLSQAWKIKIHVARISLATGFSDTKFSFILDIYKLQFFGDYTAIQSDVVSEELQN